MTNRAGFIGKSLVSTNLANGNQYANSPGVWSINDVYSEVTDSNWYFQPPVLDNFTTATTTTFQHPNNIAAGDLLVIISSNSGAGTPGTISGFTQLAFNDGSNPRIYIAYKIADGTENGSFNLSSNEAGIFALFKKPSPYKCYFDVAGTEVSAGIPGGDVPMSITTVNPGLLIACIVVGSTTSTLDSTDGMTEITNIGNGGAGAAMLYQTSSANTEYTKTPSFTNASVNRGILLNIY